LDARTGKPGRPRNVFTILPPITTYCFLTGLDHQPQVKNLPPEPTNWKEVLNHPLRNQWILGGIKELKQHQTNHTWDTVEAPENARILPATWVFKYKANSQGELTSCKVRLCIRGDEQRPGLDYYDTFASVVRPATFKILMAIVTLLDLECEQLDIISAYIKGKIDKPDVYMALPHGFPPRPTKQKLTVLLRKALYGLKQAPRLWQQELVGYLTSIGYHQLKADPCVLMHQDGAIIIIYVDDLILIHKDKARIASMKKELSSKYDLRDLGPISFYLGMKVTRDRKNRVMWIDQESYIQKILHAYHMETCKPSSIPMSPAKAQLLPRQEGEAPNNLRMEYQSLIGSLGYAANMTRADIIFATHKLCQFVSNPTDQHLSAAYQILRYLKGHQNFAIKFSATESGLLNFHGFTDAAYADNPDNRASTQGYAFFAAEGLISFKSSKQSDIATSSTEAEYVGMTNAAKEAIWIRKLLEELHYAKPDLYPIQILGDNQPAISLTKPDRKDHSKIKHIESKYHFIRHQVENGVIHLDYIPTNHMAADGLTKALAPNKFKQFIQQIGLSPAPRLETVLP
jgi:ribonuclease HI